MVLLGAGDGTFLPGVKYQTGPGPLALGLADLNGDGHLDIITANYGDGTLSLLLGNGNGTFQPQLIFPAGGAGQFGAADLNGDGKIDLISADGGPSITIYLQK